MLFRSDADEVNGLSQPPPTPKNRTTATGYAPNLTRPYDELQTLLPAQTNVFGFSDERQTFVRNHSAVSSSSNAAFPWATYSRSWVYTS